MKRSKKSHLRKSMCPKIILAVVLASLATSQASSKSEKVESIQPQYRDAFYSENEVSFLCSNIDPELVGDPEPVEPEPFYHDRFTSDTTIMSKSGLTAEQIENLVKNYPGLSGLGKAIYDVETNNGVNAFYTLAVASLESGYGTSTMARRKNNLFGMMGCIFKEKSDSVHYFGKLMNDYQKYCKMTPNGINPRYCTTSTWARDVTQIMNEWVVRACQLY